MDGRWAIEVNREALRRILAGLMAMAGLGGKSASASPTGAPPHPEARGQAGPRRTLPRHLHRAVLRLLRPAESAARRLVIAFAAIRPATGSAPVHGAVEPVPVPHAVAGIGSPALRHVSGAGASTPRPPPQRLWLPLADRIRRPAPHHPSAADAPRISVPGLTARLPVGSRRSPLPGDPLDATRLALRLSALAAALDDLPGEAQRFARWRARRARPVVRLGGQAAPTSRGIGPLRPGRASGARRRHSCRPRHAVDDILDHAQELAFWALRTPDTS